jgi:hypothetical protein
MYFGQEGPIAMPTTGQSGQPLPLPGWQHVFSNLPLNLDELDLPGPHQIQVATTNLIVNISHISPLAVEGVFGATRAAENHVINAFYFRILQDGVFLSREDAHARLLENFTEQGINSE